MLCHGQQREKYKVIRRIGRLHLDRAGPTGYNKKASEVKSGRSRRATDWWRRNDVYRPRVWDVGNHRNAFH
jgi:hypothetical protein